MADEPVLVVREWEESPSYNQPGVSKLWAAGKRLYLRKAAVEHNAVARAYLERDAQLAAMTAERDAARKPCADSCEAMLIVESQDLRLHTLMSKLTAMTAERDEAKSHAAQFFATMLDLAAAAAAAQENT